MTPRVVIADDHPVVRLGLRSAIERLGAGRIVGEAEGPDALLELLESSECDVIVTDFAMPGGRQSDGLSLINRLARSYSDIPVILVTMFANIATLRSALSAGAMGIVAKEASLDELPAAIGSAMARRRYIGRSLRQLLLQEIPVRSIDRSGLSPREAEVVRLFATGLSTGEIASTLKRTPSTISKQKASAMHRLGLSSEVDLLFFAFANGLVPRPPS